MLSIAIADRSAGAPNRNYRWRWSQRFASIAFTGLVAAFLIHDFRMDRLGPLGVGATFLVAIQSLMLILGAWWIARAFWSRLTVAHSKVVLRTPFRRKILPTESIRGRWEVKVRSGPAVFERMTVESKDPRFSKIEFDSIYNLDEQFHKWFESLPELGSEDAGVEPHSPSPTGAGS